jgi:hypothetical protein
LLKAPQAVRIADGGRPEDFDGDVAVQAAVVRAIHISHAPGADFLEDSVMT